MQYYNLYSDGNYFPRAKKSGFGGYIVAPNGDIVQEYSEQIRSLEYQHSFELLGIIRGLNIALSSGIKNIVSHCDDKNTAFKLKEIFEDKIFNISPSLKPELFNEIIEISKKFDSVKFEYIPRSQNKYADSLSRRYAEIMEINFVRQYNDDIFRSLCRFEKGQNLNKKSYFIHNSIVHTSHKNNPFLVANVRNKKVRRVSKDESRKNYTYLFQEIYSIEDNTVLKCYEYDQNKNLVGTTEKIIENCQNKEEEFCNFMAKNIKKLKSEGKLALWVNTNHQTINKILEQKDKLNKNQWPLYKKIFNSLEGMERVFFNNFPFEPEYSLENREVLKKDKKMNQYMMSIEELMEGLDKTDFSKDRGKYFGAIVRYELQNYREKLARELEANEVSLVIKNTVEKLESNGCKNIPKVFKS